MTDMTQLWSPRSPPEVIWNTPAALLSSGEKDSRGVGSVQAKAPPMITPRQPRTLSVRPLSLVVLLVAVSGHVIAQCPVSTILSGQRQLSWRVCCRCSLGTKSPVLLGVLGAPGGAEHGKEPVGRLGVLGPARGAAARRGVVVADSATWKPATITRPLSHPEGGG